MLVRNGSDEDLRGSTADFEVGDLIEALGVIRYGLPLPVGKLPAEFMARGLDGIVLHDPAVLVGAAIGEDAAVARRRGRTNCSCWPPTR